jgi:hypothetical protein
MILNLLIGLIASSAIQTAFARTWFLSEIDLRKRAQVISKIRFERTKFLIGIDPESCKKEESVDRKEQLVMKQLEEVRKRGHLSHCSHLKFPGQEALESSLVQTPMPGRIRMPETDVPKPKPIPIGAIVTPGNTPPTQVPGEPAHGGGAAPTSPTTPPTSAGRTLPPACKDPQTAAEHAARTGTLPGTGDPTIGCGGHLAWPYMGFTTRQEQDAYIAVAQTGEDLKLTYLDRGVPRSGINGLQSAKSGGIDTNFQPRTLTHFNGHEMKSEGMHALRLFYTGEEPTSGAYLNPQECRVIISGEIEYTGALIGTPTHPCLTMCQKKLKQLVEEKKPKGFYMTCHLLGETIGTDSRGDMVAQGLTLNNDSKFKCIAREGVEGRGWSQASQSYLVEETQTVLDKEVSSKAECYREFVDYYYDRAKKVPLMGTRTPTDPDVLMLYTESDGKKVKLGQFILRLPLEDKKIESDECQFDLKVLHSNYIHSESQQSYVIRIGLYLAFQAKELRGQSCKNNCPQVLAKFPPQAVGNTENYTDWSFTCADKNGIYKKCTKKEGCK